MYWRARRRLLRRKRKRRGGSAAAGKRSLARKSTAVPQAIHTRSFIQSVCL
ncbi:hypothetical protein ABE036_22625 [Priestia aryabhattai]|uniref:hypothetical protein n=1 Tax=Priestia aryabhattai TaxID=412384 RepID=UPI0004BA9A92